MLIFKHVFEDSKRCYYDYSYSASAGWELYNLEILPYGITDLSGNNIKHYYWMKNEFILPIII